MLAALENDRIIERVKEIYDSFVLIACVDNTRPIVYVSTSFEISTARDVKNASFLILFEQKTTFPFVRLWQNQWEMTNYISDSSSGNTQIISIKNRFIMRLKINKK